MAISRLVILFAAVCFISVVVQWATGRLIFRGDAAMVVLYFIVWLGAVIVGRSLYVKNELEHVNWLAISWVIFAIISIFIAVVQWTAVFDLGVYGVEKAYGDRPFGNVAQPNHLCTLAFIALCATIWLTQQHVFGRFSCLLISATLAFGMVLSQSRTGWLQMAWLGSCLLIYFYSTKNRTAIKCVALLLIFYFGLVLGFEKLSEAFLLATSRPLSDQMQSGMRMKFWIAMFDAITKEPLFGYGWQQIAAAHQAIAMDHGDFKILHEHSHNFLIDMILWNGMIFGGLALILLGMWFFQNIKIVLNRRAFWFFCALGGVMIHAMLEYPLEYAYFLIPVGLAMGSIEAAGSGKVFVIPRLLALSVLLLSWILFLLVSKDYISAEENFRSFRMESARIGVLSPTSDVPDLFVLDQLQGFLRFARNEAKEGMSDAELIFMSKIAQRFPYPSVVFRYALAMALSGKPESARISLEKLCKIHGSENCREAREAWHALSLQHPQLNEVGFSMGVGD